jgi:hypothetical protein
MALQHFDDALSPGQGPFHFPDFFHDLSITAILRDGLTIVPSARAVCFSLIIKLVPSVKFDQDSIECLVNTIADILRARDFSVLGPAVICLKQIAKRGEDCAKVVRQHIFYSILLDAIEHPSVGAEDRHCVIDLLATFSDWDFADEHLRRSVAVVQEAPVDRFAAQDRVNFLWWLLNCDRRTIRFLSNDIILPFLIACLDSANRPNERIRALLSIALLLRGCGSLFPFDYESVFRSLEPSLPKVSCAAVLCVEAMVNLNAMEFLMTHDFFGIVHRLLAEDAPFSVRVAMLKCLVKFLPKCHRGALPSLLDEELLGALVRSLEIHDVALLQSLFDFFGLVIGNEPDEITAGFWAIFEASEGWDLVSEIDASDVVPIHNLAVLFMHEFRVIELPDDM